MNEEYHLFIIWNKARKKERQILAIIDDRFDILYEIYLTWSDKNFASNLTRFYGVNLPPDSGKEKHIGKGQFVVVIVKDKEPNYEYHGTSKGKEYVNSNIFTHKTKFRELTGGGHKIHATNTSAEFMHDFALLFGCSIDNFFSRYKPYSGKPLVMKNDLVGSNGWDSLEQVFDVLNMTEDYVVLRNFDPLPDKYYADNHGDIDLLVGRYDSSRYALNATPVFSEAHRVHNKIIVNNAEVFLDIRYVGDKYYCSGWESNILAEKEVYNGVNIPNKHNLFYTLLYHALIHKPSVAIDYIKTLDSINSQINEVGGAITKKWITSNSSKKLLAEYMFSNKYKITKPEPSVYYNVDNVALVDKYITGAKWINDLKKDIDIVATSILDTVSRSDSRMYYKAKDNSNKPLFIKSGVYGYKSEFDISKKMYDLSQKYFIEPVYYKSGDINYFISRWTDGEDLDKYLAKNRLTKEQKIKYLDDLLCIFKLLRKARIVHRDLIPRNFMVSGDRLILIDFYWAVNVDNYVEYEYVQDNISRLRKLGEEYSLSPYVWDDAYSVLKVAKLIQGENRLTHEIFSYAKAKLGKRTITPRPEYFDKSIIEAQNNSESLNNKINTLIADNKELLDEVESLRIQIRDLENRNNAILNSTSWKITKPLRTGGSKLKRTKSGYIKPINNDSKK